MIELKELFGKSGEYVSTLPCPLHGGHTIYIIPSEDKLLFKCSQNEDEYFVVDKNFEIDFNSENLSLYNREYVIEYLKTYLKHCKVFSKSDLEKTFKDCFELALERVNYEPFTVDCEIKVRYTHVNVRIKLEDTEGLKWSCGHVFYIKLTQSGMLLTFPKIRKSTFQGKYCYIASRNLKTKLTQWFENAIMYAIDEYHCNYKNIVLENKLQKLADKIKSELNLNVERYTIHYTLIDKDFKITFYTEDGINMDNVSIYVNKQINYESVKKIVEFLRNF